MQVVDRILQYMKASPGKGLLFRREGSLSMEIYADAYYARLDIIENPLQDTACF